MRVNAENPAKGFMPAPGHIGTYREPAGPGVRVDSGTEGNSDIPQAYDPLVSKVITYGADRRRRMLRALSEYEVEGIKTTIPFHRLMLADERFISGEYHTGTVEREMDLSVLKEDLEPRPKVGAGGLVARFGMEVNEVEPGETVRPKKSRPTSSLCRRRWDGGADRADAGNHRQGAGRARGPGERETPSASSRR